jgi:hypothetical protein
MIMRVVSGVMAALGLWAAYLQLNDPDPERWFALYFATALVAGSFALGKPLMKGALALAAIALSWALAIVPELWGRWSPSDLGAKMVVNRPEIEFGREFGGLLIVTVYLVCAFLITRRSQNTNT